jgi:hypothetical protein
VAACRTCLKRYMQPAEEIEHCIRISASTLRCGPLRALLQFAVAECSVLDFIGFSCLGDGRCFFCVGDDARSRCAHVVMLDRVTLYCRFFCLAVGDRRICTCLRLATCLPRFSVGWYTSAALVFGCIVMSSGMFRNVCTLCSVGPCSMCTSLGQALQT